MIIDNFMYNNDSELLELRYYMLKDVVDYFVISEANHTFTGIPKSFNAKNHVKELGLDQDKFIFLEVDTSEHFLKVHEMDVDNAKKVGSPDKVSIYTRLRQQKDAIMSILHHFSDDTTFIIGDVDEIPKPDAVKYMAKVCQEHPNNILKIPLVLLESRADRRVYDENNKPVEWRRSLAFCTKQQVKHKGPSILRAEWEPLGGTFTYHPIGITENGQLVEDLGWHFTWMGNKEKKIEKAKSCAHATALHLINNLSNETKELLKKDVSDNIAQEYNYHQKPYDTKLLPKEIFERPRVQAFLLPSVTYKVVDYFMYFNEKELFELRYHMLKDVVDLFVVSESNTTFTGKNKGFEVEHLISQLKLDRTKFKIIQNDLKNLEENSYNHIDLVSSQAAKDTNVLAWTRERLQRDGLMKVIDEFDDDCVFIISDIDEIIKPSSVPYLAKLVKENRQVLIKVPLVLLESRADKRMVKQDGSIVPWDRSMFLATKSHLKQFTPNTLRGENQKVLPTVYITENNGRVEDLGWHFTWMGDVARQQIKAKNYGHAGNLNVVNTLSQSTVKNLESTLGKKIELKTSYNLVDYDVENLPQEIFELPNVKKFLLPEISVQKRFDNKKLLDYIDDPNNPRINFDLAYEYEKIDQIAAAVSYYLRAAERTNSLLLQYECFLRLGKCFQFQKNRNFTVTGLFIRAITLKPNRPEAYFLLAKHYYDTSDYQNAYLYSTIGMSLINFDSGVLTTKVDYESVLDLKYIQSTSGWYVGFYQQAKDSLRKIKLEINENELDKEKYSVQIEKFFSDVIKEKC